MCSQFVYQNCLFIYFSMGGGIIILYPRYIRDKMEFHCYQKGRGFWSNFHLSRMICNKFIKNRLVEQEMSILSRYRAFPNKYPPLVITGRKIHDRLVTE